MSQAPLNLSPQQRSALESTYTFLRAVTVHLEAALPHMRGWDETSCKNMIAFSVLCQSKLVQSFPEVAEWEKAAHAVRGGL